MVGRLVEEQHLGLPDQRPCQQDPAPPPSGQRGNDCIGRQAEARQDQLDPLLETPAVALLERVLQLPQAGQRRVEAGRRDLERRVVVLGHQRREIAEPLGDDIEHRALGRQRHVLLEPGGACPGLQPAQTGIRLERSVGDLEEGGLAGAVAPDDGNALPRLDLQRDLVEERFVPVRHGHVIENEDGHAVLHATGAGRPNGHATRGHAAGRGGAPADFETGEGAARWGRSYRNTLVPP